MAADRAPAEEALLPVVPRVLRHVPVTNIRSVSRVARCQSRDVFRSSDSRTLEYKAVNVAALAALSEKIGKTEIGLEDIKLAGLAQSRELVKVLGNGDINVAITVTADAFSASAVSKIEAAGGKANVIGE